MKDIEKIKVGMKRRFEDGVNKIEQRVDDKVQRQSSLLKEKREKLESDQKQLEKDR